MYNKIELLHYQANQIFSVWLLAQGAWKLVTSREQHATRHYYQEDDVGIYSLCDAPWMGGASTLGSYSEWNLVFLHLQ